MASVGGGMEADSALYVLTVRRAVAARFEPNDRHWPRTSFHPRAWNPGGCPPGPLPSC